MLLWQGFAIGETKMRIAFLDVVDYDYTPEMVYEQPLGGSSSAVCYLAEELVKQGQEVFLLNKTTTPGVFFSGHCYRLWRCLSICVNLLTCLLLLMYLSMVDRFGLSCQNERV